MYIKCRNVFYPFAFMILVFFLFFVFYKLQYIGFLCVLIWLARFLTCALLPVSSSGSKKVSLIFSNEQRLWKSVPSLNHRAGVPAVWGPGRNCFCYKPSATSNTDLHRRHVTPASCFISALFCHLWSCEWCFNE